MPCICLHTLGTGDGSCLMAGAQRCCSCADCCPAHHTHPKGEPMLCRTCTSSRASYPAVLWHETLALGANLPSSMPGESHARAPPAPQANAPHRGETEMAASPALMSTRSEPRGSSPPVITLQSKGTAPAPQVNPELCKVHAHTVPQCGTCTGTWSKPRLFPAFQTREASLDIIHFLQRGDSAPSVLKCFPVYPRHTEIPAPSCLCSPQPMKL